MNRRIIKTVQGPSFPLYDSILAEIKTRNITEPNPKTWTQISKVEKDNARIIFLLIMHYARLHGNKDEIPYARKIPEGGKGAIYDVDTFPHELKLILSRCIEEITD